MKPLFVTMACRENRDRATSQGHRHPIDPTPARYVRVTILSKSANPAVHLVEVRAFDAERAAE